MDYDLMENQKHYFSEKSGKLFQWKIREILSVENQENYFNEKSGKLFR